MHKWEYQIIEVVKGMINQVNGQLVYKTPPKGLSGGEMYSLPDYLSIIGQESWEVVVGGEKALLYESDRSIVYNQIAALIAKRPMS